MSARTPVSRTVQRNVFLASHRWLGTRSVCTPAGAVRDGALGLTGRLPLGEGLPLVVRLLATRQRDLDLGVAVLEVQRQRHDRQAGLLGLADQPMDLALLEQQLAHPAGGVVVPRALRVLGD